MEISGPGLLPSAMSRSMVLLQLVCTMTSMDHVGGSLEPCCAELAPHFTGPGIPPVPCWILQQESFLHCSGESCPPVLCKDDSTPHHRCAAHLGSTRTDPVIRNTSEQTLEARKQDSGPCTPLHMPLGSIGEENIPLLPARAGPRIMRVRELALSLSSSSGSSTQETRPCTPPGQHSRADLVVG